MEGTNARRRRRYTPEFKDEAAKMVIEISRLASTSPDPVDFEHAEPDTVLLKFL
jgi:hypothetical protein